MSKSNSQKTSDWSLYGRLLRYVFPYWYVFGFSILGFAVYSAGNVLLADLMQFLIDSLNGVETENSGIVAVLAYQLAGGDISESPLAFARVAVPVAAIAIAVTRALGFFFGSYFMSFVARNLIHDLRCELFNKMLVVPSSYYDKHNQGELISKITFNVEQVSGAVTKAFKTLVRDGLTVIGLVGYMLYLNWQLTLVFFAVAPLIGLVVSVVGKHFRRYSRKIQNSMGDVTQVSNETIGAYREVRIFGGQTQQQQNFHDASEFNRKQSLKLAFADALSTPVIQGLLAIALSALIWFALDPEIISGFGAGKLVAFLTAAGQLSKPIRSLTGVQSLIQRGLAASEDIFAQLDERTEPDRGQRSIERATGSIEFSGLSFAYPGIDEPVLQDINLRVEAGQTVALVGPSGSGKTTLMHLLARFYQPGQGSILLDGISIDEYRLADLRRQLAAVSQSVTLFHDSVYNNVAYGALAKADEAAVLRACELAYAKDFIEQLPQGFNTLLGDDGAGLSGGQRQRLAIARAILKDAPVLILDEATSALDNESEHRIQRAMENIMADRTTFVIAHRLTTVERADTIVVLDRGRIQAQGSHQQLLAQGGLYAQLYNQEFSD